MKYLKTLESNINRPELGDYVIINVEPGTGLPNNIKNKIGQIIDISNDTLISIYYSQIDYSLPYIHKSFIEHTSKNKEDLEQIVNTKKYNI